MKRKFSVALFLVAVLAVGLCGCSFAEAGRRMDVAEDRLEARMDDWASAGMDAHAARITREQAEAIALEHAGLTTAQVTGLHTEYEIDEGVPRYEVQFYYDRWEYDCEIDADSGVILSYDRDI